MNDIRSPVTSGISMSLLVLNGLEMGEFLIQESIVRTLPLFVIRSLVRAFIMVEVRHFS